MVEHLEGGETEFSLTTASKQIAVELNEDYYMTAPGIVASAINETNEMSGSKSLALAITIKTQTGDDNISPVIDTSRLSCHLIRNHLLILYQEQLQTLLLIQQKVVVVQLLNIITRPIILANESTALDVRIICICSRNFRSRNVLSFIKC